MWGRRVPDNALARWGARAVYLKNRQGGGYQIALTQDRVPVTGPRLAKDKLGKWLYKVGMPRLKAEVARLGINPYDKRIVTIVKINANGSKFVLEGSPQGSYCYFYLSAWMASGGLPMRGLL